ncbi:unnamed protein product [Rodentolepis nana]|uniref:RNA helicase n=1 Tax=Rodentolepis nana TaxID=102285 RepID=A0A0R3T300_RODNA|nr:unnamed protein product [Rodentolepis nana]
MECSDIHEFDISEETVKKLEATGITKLYKVQAETYEHIKNGQDVITLAKTGSGKTLAFSIPLIELMKAESIRFDRFRTPMAIILAPTRELVVQTTKVLQSIAPDGMSVIALYGGVAYDQQVRALRSGVDIVVGAPGRVIDLMESGKLKLTSIKFVILDEVDRMLDMGFSADVEKILSSVYDSETKPQTLLFSATLPNWVSNICKRYVSKDCHKISLVNKEEARTADRVEHLAINCPYHERARALADTIRVYSKGPNSRCIVFCEKKKEADELAAHESMQDNCHVFHGGIPQDKREFILQKFREGKYKTLMTTNVAARGLDIPDVELVIQCAPPSSVEDYIHRSGRTGRAGRSGISIVFYTNKQKSSLTFVERGAGITFKRISAPSANEIVDVCAEELSQTFAEIPETIWSAFLPAARRLVQSLHTSVNTEDLESTKKLKKSKKSKRKPEAEEQQNNGHVEIPTCIYEKVLCCALAKISGKLKAIESRSALTAYPGMTAYRLDIPENMTAHKKGLCYSLLSNQLDPETTESIRNLSFIKGRKGYVFDVPDDKVEIIDSTWENGSRGIMLSKLTEIPELEPEADEMNGSRNGNFRFGNGNGFRGGFRGRGSNGGAGRFNGGGFGRGGNFRGGQGGFGRGGGGRGMKRRMDFDSDSRGPAKQARYE